MGVIGAVKKASWKIIDVHRAVWMDLLTVSRKRRRVEGVYVMKDQETVEGRKTKAERTEEKERERGGDKWRKTKAGGKEVERE